MKENVMEKPNPDRGSERGWKSVPSSLPFPSCNEEKGAVWPSAWEIFGSIARPEPS